MTTFTTIPNSSLEPGKPIRSIDGLALRDNPISMFEGDASAPKLADAALSTTVTNAGRDWVLARTATLAIGSVGSYAFLAPPASGASNVGYDPNSTAAGSSLRYAGGRSTYRTAGDDAISGTSPSGTWRCLGRSQRIHDSCTGQYFIYGSLWIRIS